MSSPNTTSTSSYSSAAQTNRQQQYTGSPTSREYQQQQGSENVPPSQYNLYHPLPPALAAAQARQQTVIVGPRTKGQNTAAAQGQNHQVLFNQRLNPIKLCPTATSHVQKTSESSTEEKFGARLENGEVSGTSGQTASSCTPSEKQESSTAECQTPSTETSANQKKPAKRVTQRKSGTARSTTSTRTKKVPTAAAASATSTSSGATKTVRTKRQATGAVAQVAAQDQNYGRAVPVPTSTVFQRHAKTYELRGHWGRVDHDGTHWLKRVPEDYPPKKFSDIPSCSPFNKIEFPYWESFKGRFSTGYTLYTEAGYRYWADSGAARWLEAAERNGQNPSNSIFVVKHVVENGLDGFVYGFKHIDKPVVVDDNEYDPIEVDSEDEEMTDAAAVKKKMMEVDEEELARTGVPTPKMSDDEGEDKNEFE